MGEGSNSTARRLRLVQVRAVSSTSLSVDVSGLFAEAEECFAHGGCEVRCFKQVWADDLEEGGEADSVFPPLADLTPYFASTAISASHTQKRRIASVEYFDRYITLNIGPADINDAFVDAAVTDAMTSTETTESWTVLTNLIPDNAEAILDKARRIATNGEQAATLLPKAVAWHDTIPADAGLFSRARLVHDHWCTDLALAATSKTPEDLADQTIQASGIEFASRIYRQAMKRTTGEEAEVQPSKDFPVAARHIAARIRQHLEESSTTPFTYDTPFITLLQAWEQLEPAFDRRSWLRQIISDEHSPWTGLDILSCFVTRATMVGGSGRWHLTSAVDLAEADRLIGLPFISRHCQGELSKVAAPPPNTRDDATPENRQAAAIHALRQNQWTTTRRLTAAAYTYPRTWKPTAKAKCARPSQALMVRTGLHRSRDRLSPKRNT